MKKTKIILPLLLSCALIFSEKSMASTASAAVGVCGAANGKTATVAPAGAICTAGVATPVSGKGPWTWMCLGNSVANTAQCKVLLGTATVASPSPVTSTITTPVTTPVTVPLVTTPVVTTPVVTTPVVTVPVVTTPVVTTPVVTTPTTTTLTTTVAKPLTLAAYAGFPDSVYASNQVATTAGYNSLVAAIGQKPSMYLTYIDMTHPLSNWYWNAAWAVSSWQATPWLKGVTPVIGLPMAIVGEDGMTDMQAIVAGSWDSTILSIFGLWSNAGYTAFYLRPGWEMNGGWYPWSVNATTYTTYVAAFQHIANLAHQYAGAKITVVWNPNVGSNAAIPMSSYYPGDAYVDVVGLDTYGAPLNSDNSPLFVSSSSADVELQMIMAFANAHGKRFALPEVGGNDTAFPINLGYAVSQAKQPIDFMGLWDFGTSADLMAWSTSVNVAAAWKMTIAEITAAAVPAQLASAP